MNFGIDRKLRKKLPLFVANVRTTNELCFAIHICSGDRVIVLIDVVLLPWGVLKVRDGSGVDDVFSLSYTVLVVYYVYQSTSNVRMYHHGNRQLYTCQYLIAKINCRPEFSATVFDIRIYPFCFNVCSGSHDAM